MAIQEIESGKTHGLQVRVGQGPGQTKFLAFKKHGGKRKTKALAVKIEAELESIHGKRQRIPTGRLQKNNRSGVPGIRFEWFSSVMYSYLYMMVSYTSKAHGKSAHSWSIDRNGLEPLIIRALSIREKHGAPKMSFEEAMTRIRPYYRKMLHG